MAFDTTTPEDPLVAHPSIRQTTKVKTTIETFLGIATVTSQMAKVQYCHGGVVDVTRWVSSIPSSYSL